jgi:MFS family permease
MFIECILYIYGVFLKPLIEEFGWLRGSVSSIHAVMMATYTITVIPIGRIYDKYGPGKLMSVSCILIGLGLMLSSIVSSIWQLYFTFSVMLGLGFSPIYLSSMSTVMRRLTSRSGLAVGIATSGIGIGQLVMAPFLTYTIGIYGWRAAFIVSGIFSMLIIAFAAIIISNTYRSLMNTSSNAELYRGETLSGALRTWIFKVVYFSYVMACFALFIVLVHMVPYSIDIVVDPLTASYWLGLVGVSSVPGRVVMGFVSDRIGKAKTFALCCLIEGLLIPLLLAGRYVLLPVFALFFGFFYGGLMAMYAPLISELFGLKHIGSILGTIATAFGIGGTLGPTFAGYIFDVFGSYIMVFTICMVMFIIVALLIMGLARRL